MIQTKNDMNIFELNCVIFRSPTTDFYVSRRYDYSHLCLRLWIG